jgi:hypothetical protein
VVDRLARFELIKGEAELRYQAGQADRVGQLGLSVAAEEPRWAAWWHVTASSDSRESISKAARVAAGWTPTNPDTWNILGHSEPDSSDDQRLRMFRRAVGIAPDFPLWSCNYATMLIKAGSREQARTIAGRFASGGPQQVATAEAIMAMVQASEGKFLEAFERSRRALLGLETFGLVEMSDPHLLRTAFGTASILGRSRTLADKFAQRFVLPEPTRLAQGHFAPSWAADACAVASPEIAAQCFARLGELVRDGWFIEGLLPGTDGYLEGGERFSRGDFAAAAAAWRPLVAGGYGSANLTAAAFDSIGEYEIASSIDAKYLQYAELYHGATMAHVREARRAVIRKDIDRARELAQQVIDAWSMADVEVLVVDEMRELLAKLSPENPRKQ